jgi:hypothetical protein
MKKLKSSDLTPEDLGSKLTDKDFLRSDGTLFFTSRTGGKSKKLGEIILNYCCAKFPQREGTIFLSIRINFSKKNERGIVERIGGVGYDAYHKDDNVQEPTICYYIANDKDTSYFARSIGLSREAFIDHMFSNYPQTREWIIWNL